MRNEARVEFERGQEAETTGAGPSDGREAGRRRGADPVVYRRRDRGGISLWTAQPSRGEAESKTADET